MMVWLQSLDTALFRWVNQWMVNPVFDWLMPKLAGHSMFVPALLVAGGLLLWKGGRRGRLLAVFLAVVVIGGDTLVCKTLKQAVARPRPFVTLNDARTLIGRGPSYSMPSSHAANWFAAAMVAFIFFRRSARYMVPAAATVAFSRVYDGVHYPSDVLAGAILGAGYAAATVWSADALWRWAGRRWFPLWWRKLPSLMDPDARLPEDRAAGQAPGLSAAPDRESAARLDQHWLRLGYVVIAALLLFRLGYLASDTITLTKDEAYQWLWSKHLALSYYSKPPAIALIQYAGTSLWGDTQFGVRFFSPVFAALLSLVLLRFLARTVGARASFLLLLILTATPLMDLGTILMTIDPPLVLCWTLAMVVGWRAAQPDGRTKDWLLVGLGAGLGFLSKYNAAYLLFCWALFFALWKPARVHLRRPGPYLALLVFALCTLPVIIWNSQNGWITALHVSENAALAKPWKPTLRYLWEFLFAELFLLNPIFFVGALWAGVAFWKRRAQQPLWLYFSCMGMPVFLGHWAYSLHSRILPNWIAPAVLPMFCLMVAYWEARWREGARGVRSWLIAGLALGLVAGGLAHESKLIGKIVGRPLPAEKDPLRRARAWTETAAVVEQARQALMAEGKPVFIIADHYGMTGQFSFHLPEAKAAVGTAQPLVYYQSSPRPDNQLYFWPEYRYRGRRTGQNAIFVFELDPYPLEKGWVWRWLTHQPVRYADESQFTFARPQLREEFESVTDLGVREVKLDDRVFRRVQLFACRNLRPGPDGK
jgi:membrane-associated phospholipid phosphatase